MTRLFHGSTLLVSLCAMTLVVGCGGSSTPKVPCDGGACGDAKRDTSRDGGSKAEVPVRIPDGAVVIPDGAVVIPDGGVVIPDGAVVIPDGAVVIPDAPADVPPVIIDAPADLPPVITDVAADLPPVITDVAPSPAEVTPPDATSATDAAPDAPTAIPDAAAPQIDVAADTAADAPAAEVAVPDAGPDGACPGVLCNNFEGDNPDAGLPSSFTAVDAGSTTWSVVVDGSATFLEGDHTSGGAEYLKTGVATWTDQTITVKVRITATVGGSVRICGRFTSEDAAYCLDIGISGTGSTPGTMYLLKRTSGSATLGSIVSELPITVGTWHTYRFSLSGSSTVQLKAYLDNASTPTVSASDNSGPYTAGAAALGVYNLVTADFDDLVVTTP